MIRKLIYKLYQPNIDSTLKRLAKSGIKKDETKEQIITNLFNGYASEMKKEDKEDCYEIMEEEICDI